MWQNNALALILMLVQSTQPRILDILIYFRIRHSFEHLRPVILSADWSISRLQSWTCSSLPTVAEFVKLTQSIVIEIQRQSADLYKVQLCNRQFFVVSTAIYVVKVYECHPLDSTFRFVHLTHQNLSARALFCHNSLAKVNGQLLICNWKRCCCGIWDTSTSSMYKQNHLLNLPVKDGTLSMTDVW